MTLSGRPDAGDVLAALEQETSLILSSGEGRIFYRVHPLLRSTCAPTSTVRRPTWSAACTPGPPPGSRRAAGPRPPCSTRASRATSRRWWRCSNGM